nr:MAG TPA: hypothetical protein [Caudoviricetes sp.]
MRSECGKAERDSNSVRERNLDRHDESFLEGLVLIIVDVKNAKNL